MKMAEEMNSLVSDSSFVILGESSLPHDLNSINSMSTQNLDLSQMMQSQRLGSTRNSVTGNLSTSQNSWGSHISSSEIQSKLDQLVNENQLLKETLNQSNMVMKNQFDTLALWQQEVAKTHEAHKQKFLETQSQIMKLKSENASLKKKFENDLVSLNSGEFKSLNKDEEISLVQSLRDKLDLSEGNCSNLKTEFKELSLRNDQFKKIVSLLREANINFMKKITGNDESSLLLKEYLENEMSLLNSLLESDNAKLNASTVSESLKLGKADGRCKENIIGRGEGEKMSIEPDVSIINSLLKSMDRFEGSEKGKEIEQLKKELKEEKEMSKQKGYEIEEMNMVIKDLRCQIKDFQQSISDYKEKISGLPSESATRTQEMENLTAELNQKSQELEELKKEMKTMVLNCEEVVLLQTQVELYQNDFNEERKARERAVGEKEELAKELRQLKKTLNDLQSKVESSSISPSAPVEESLPELNARRKSYRCPKCMFMLPSLEECQTHVNACLDLYDTLP